MSKQPIFFCDFDGTVTETDNIVALMKKFAPPEGRTIAKKVLSERISIREGVGKLFSLLSSDRKTEYTQFLQQHAVIRDGFAEFVNFTKDQGIPFYIVSGGIDFFVYPMLAGLVAREQIFCNGSDFSGVQIQVLWPHACDSFCTNDCGCCKPSILRRFSDQRYEKIVIGDSITDWQAAQLADYVYARDLLLQKCQEKGIPHTAFATFHDILHHFSQRL